MRNKFKRIIEEIEKYKNVIMGGDFNSHHKTWGSQKTDGFGKIIEEIINNSGLVILNEVFIDQNKNKSTYINNPNQAKSVIDLTIVTNNIINNINKYEITNENCHSDHACIKITLNEKGCENSEITRYKINLETYKEELNELNMTKLKNLQHFEQKHKQIIENNTEIKKMKLD